MGKIYTPSKIKSVIKSGNLTNTIEMVKSPEFPKKMMVDILSKEAPSFISHRWGEKIHHATVMAEMLNSKQFTDEEVEALLHENASLKGLSFYCERIGKKHFLESLDAQISGKKFTDITMWLIVRHPHFPMDDAYNLIDRIIDNTASLTAIATECTCSNTLEKLYKFALEKNTDESNCIISALAGNKNTPKYIVDKFFELDKKALNISQVSEFCYNLLKTFKHTFEQGEFIRAEAAKSESGNMVYTLSQCDSGMIENASMTKEQALSFSERISSTCSWETLFGRLEFTQEEREDILLRYANENSGICQAIIFSTEELSEKAIVKFVESCEDNTLINSLLSNQNVPVGILDLLAYDPDTNTQRLVAVHPSVSESTYNSLFRVRAEMQKAKSFYTFKASSAFSCLTSLKKFEILHEDYGFDLFDFKFVTSQKKMLQMIIGSKHPQEIDFVYGAGTAESITAISTLQSVFTNEKGKIDRFGYLSFLTKVNESFLKSDHPARRIGLSVDALSLGISMRILTTDEVISVLHNNEDTESQDIFRLFSSLINQDDEDENEKQTTLIRRWLDKSNNFGDAFHTYLSNKQQRDLGYKIHNSPFYQKNAEDEIEAIKGSLPNGIKLTLPVNSAELKALGRKQRHCVGTKYYADRCIDGSAIIFALSTGMASDEMYTYQFERHSGRLSQSKGFANSTTPARLESVARDVFNRIKKACESEYNKALDTENHAA